jgi:GMP synthase-like glutamine amidotransferase
MILVLQFRTDQSGWHEVKCIYDSVEKGYNDFLFMNIMSPFVTTEMILDKLSQAKAVILGGLGEGGYEDEEPHKVEARQTMLQKITPIIETIRDRNIPTLGMCFGHQVIADILGGEVVSEPSMAESGIAEIILTEEGKNDPLLASMPEIFHGIVSHKSSVVELPKGAVLLAYSKKCPIQGFRYQSHIYGLQLHPELDLNDYHFRMQLYPEYTKHKVNYDENQEIIAKQILTNFLNQI